jgi:hypothetical protein
LPPGRARLATNGEAHGGPGLLGQGERFVASDHPQEAKDILGRDVLTAYAPVTPLGWLVFVEMPIEEAK